MSLWIKYYIFKPARSQEYFDIKKMIANWKNINRDYPSLFIAFDFLRFFPI